jgi:bifunctional DNA-binding transcriptional regulator/antitoxin component of YhaV-PrlF toxin-antitoxin module
MAGNLGDRGRLVLPAELRHAARLEEGDLLSATLEADGVRLTSRPQAARVGRGMFAHLAPERDLVAEFIAERRAYLSRESADRPLRARQG